MVHGFITVGLSAFRAGFRRSAVLGYLLAVTALIAGCQFENTESAFDLSGPTNETDTESNNLTNQIDSGSDSLEVSADGLPKGCSWGYSIRGDRVPLCADLAPPPPVAGD
jgi:hypothetical protein